MKRLLLPLFYFMISFAFSQESNLYVSNTTAQKRSQLFLNLTKNLKRDLNYAVKTDNEDHWLNAFSTIQLFQSKDSFVLKRITNAMDSIEFTSDNFKKELIQTAFANFQGKFKAQTGNQLNRESNPEVFVMLSLYFLQQNWNDEAVAIVQNKIKFFENLSLQDNELLNVFKNELKNYKTNNSLSIKQISTLLEKNFLPGNIIMFSFQRKNRDYPGLAIIRNASGEFIKDTDNTILSIPQLARSISGMPYYIRYGNTPQGLYKMNGFGVSMSGFIGPTPNIQFQMPGEVTPQVFLNDSTIIDSSWSTNMINKLLPPDLQNYQPLFQSLNAGVIGRSEIIAHGTTINPDYYFGKPWFPHTPSEGCLTTIELWNGKRYMSNQQKIITGLLKAGGAHGYCIVIELNDKNAPVSIEEILPLIKAAEKQ